MSLGPILIEGKQSLEVIPTFVQGQQSDFNILQGAECVSVGTMTTTIVSGNYNVTIVNNHFGPEPSSCDPAVPFDEIATWVKAPDFLRIYEEALSQRLSKTGIWFIESEEFRKLVEEREVVVWGTGMPGAGKTLLSSTSMEHLREIFAGTNGVAVVCAFIRYTEQPSARDILAGLIRQLIGSHLCACRHMGNLYIQNQKMELREQGLIKALREVVGLLSKVFIIIDGLDEAEDAVKDALLRTLPTLGANVLIMSRPLELYAHCIPHALHVSIAARTEDIDYFVDDQIERNSRLQAIVRGDPTLIERLKARIRESSNGMFLVARLQMEAIVRKARSANTLLTGLEQLPSGVDAIYEHTLARINAQSEEDASIAHRAFIWLLYAKDSLTSDDLQHALAISFEDKSYDAGDVIPLDLILSMCGGLVTVEKLGLYNQVDSVRFIHYTAHEYLKKVPFPELARPHTYLAVSCLVYLESNSLQRWEEWDFRSYDHLGYADRNWGYHARDSQEEDAEIHPYISLFLRSCGARYCHYFEGNAPMYQLGGLHLAAMYGLVKIISTETLPFLTGRLRQWDRGEWVDGQTPFHYAAKYGETSALKALLNSYTGINIPNAKGETPLIVACRNPSSSGTAQIIGEGFAAPRAKDCQQEIIRILTGHTAVKVNMQDNLGQTALMVACRVDTDDAIPIFLLSLRPKINVNIKDNAGRTAFMYACKPGLRKTVAYMLNQAAIDINEVDNDGKTAFMHFCTHPRHNRIGRQCAEGDTLEFLTLLTQHGADHHVRDNRSRSAFLWAAAPTGIKRTRMIKKAPPTHILRYLLEIDSLDCNQQDNEGTTALMLASCGRIQSLEILLSYPKTDVNAQDAKGMTALHRCCSSGTPEALEMLVSHPAVNLRLPDNRGWSALDCACWRRGEFGAKAIAILARLGHWEDSDIRKAVIQFFAGQYDCGQVSLKATLVSLPLSPSTFKAFKWTTDDPITWVLLGYALRDYCRVAAVLILINCGIFPSWETAEEGKKYCRCVSLAGCCLDYK